MEARRSLRDLYKVRAPVEFSDPDTGDEIRVWVAKLNSREMEAVERAAAAAKALVLVDRDNPKSDVFLAHLSELLLLPDPNDAIPFIIAEKVQEARLSIAARLATEGKWGDDDLYESIIDRWTGDPDTPDSGLQWIFAAYIDEPDETPETPDLVPRWREAQKVFGLLEEFNDEVNALLEEEIKDLAEPYRIEPDEHGEYDHDERQRLLSKAAKVFVEANALDAYWQEFSRQRAYFSTRQRHTQPDADGNEVAGPESRLPFFASIDEYDGCDDHAVKDVLRNAYDGMSLAGLEGKGSPAATTSSSPPDSPAAAEDSAPSGPTESSE